MRTENCLTVVKNAAKDITREYITIDKLLIKSASKTAADTSVGDAPPSLVSQSNQKLTKIFR